MRRTKFATVFNIARAQIVVRRVALGVLQHAVGGVGEAVRRRRQQHLLAQRLLRHGL